MAVIQIHARCPSLHCDFDRYTGCRVGEASHPGPQLVRVCVSNVGSILGKIDHLDTLDSHVTVLSETCATLASQEMISRKLCKSSHTPLWGAPVDVKKTSDSSATLFRGHNSGVAVFSKVPARYLYAPATCSAFISGRLLPCLIRLGPFDVLLIAVYGVPSSRDIDGKVNDEILRQAFDLASSYKIPSLIVGDFNVRPQQLDSFSSFMSLGFIEVFEWFQRQGITLPPTCKDSTCHDTALIHPTLVPYLQHACVDVLKKVDVHAPLFLDFGFEDVIPVQYRWVFPATWSDDSPPSEFFETQYVQQCDRHPFLTESNLSLQEQFLQWSRNIEQSVHHYRQQANAHGQHHLPQRQRGRCQWQPLRKMQPPKTIRQCWGGGYNPPDDTTSLPSHHKVRQVRRLQGLFRSRAALEHTPVLCPRRCTQLHFQHQNEWNAILRARGFGHSFSSWLLGQEGIFYVPQQCPDADFLFTAFQLVKFDADILVKQEAKHRKEHFKSRLALEAKKGNLKSLFADLRGKGPPPIKWIEHNVTTTARLQRSPKGDAIVSIDEAAAFSCGMPATFGDAQVIIRKIHGSYVHLQVISGVCPAVGNLTQQKSATQVCELDYVFTSYWNTFWQRDQFEPVSSWEEACETVVQCVHTLPQIEIPWQDTSAWSHVLSLTKSGSAAGACGWRFEELKLLPPSALRHLILLYGRVLDRGEFPEPFMRARVSLLGKTDNPRFATDARPITIIGCIVRLFTKFSAFFILRSWTSSFPAAISGGLPGRGVRLFSWLQQFAAEVANIKKTPVAGLSLDLVKAFNLLPRIPLGKLMEHLNVPSNLVAVWIAGLGNLSRRFTFHGAYGQQVPSFSGVPEGCALSVCAMLAFGFLFHYHVSQTSAVPTTYVDNINFTAHTSTQWAAAFEVTRVFMDVWSMQIDWRKTWVWANAPHLRKFLETFPELRELYPDQVPLLDSAQELGLARIYNQRPSPSALHARVGKGVSRAKCIPRTLTFLSDRARMVQKAIWPLALYGAESQYLSSKEMQRLRRAACSAVVGPWQQACAWIACSFLHQELVDPFFFVIINILALLKQVHDTYPHIVLEFLGYMQLDHPHRSVGPISTCAMYLKKLRWELSDTGLLSGPPGFRPIQILQISRKDLKARLIAWWPIFVYQQIAHRRGVETWLMSRQITIKVLNKFHGSAHGFLASRITNAFQSQQAKAGWKGNEVSNPACQHCGLECTTDHVIFACPFFQEIRQEHAPALDLLRDKYPAWKYLPVAGVSAGLVAISEQLNSMPIYFDLEIPSHLVDLPAMIFFTDGGCRNPSIPLARRASWAVVQSCLTTDEQVVRFLQAPPSGYPLQDQFCALGCGIIPGQQDIARAELYAIAAIIVAAHHQQCKAQITVYSDSAYAVSILKWVSIHPHARPGDFRHLANQDIIQCIVHCWIPDQFRVLKVKAHREIHDAVDPFDCFLVVGNDVADRLASAALDLDVPEARIAVQCIRHSVHDIEFDLHQVYSFYLALDRFKVANEQKKLDKHCLDVAISDQAQSKSFDETVQWIVTWPTEDPIQVTFETLPDNFRQAIPAGQLAADAIWTWMHTIEWSSRQAPLESDPGINALELLLSFTLHTGLRLPVPWKTNSKTSYTSFRDYDSVEIGMLPPEKRSAGQQANTLVTIMRQLDAISGKWHLPVPQQMNIQHLKIFYPLRMIQVFPIRPKLPFAGKVIRDCISYLQLCRTDSCTAQLTMPLWTFCVHPA